MHLRICARKRFYKYKWSCHSQSSTHTLHTYTLPFKTVYLRHKKKKKTITVRPKANRIEKVLFVKLNFKKRRSNRMRPMCLGLQRRFLCDIIPSSLNLFMYTFYLFMCIFQFRIIAIKCRPYFHIVPIHLIYLNKQFLFFYKYTLRHFCVRCMFFSSVLFSFNCLAKCVDFGHTSAFSSLTFDDTEPSNKKEGHEYRC